MNCIIVDDNKMARTVLKHFVREIDFLNLVGEYENVMQATSMLSIEKIDLLLLDVEMPKMSGIDFLKSVTNHPLTILITANPNYAVEAFEYNVVDFLVKPVKEDRFLKAVFRAKEIFDSNSKPLEIDKEYFFIREKGISTKLLIADILYIQALGDYITIYTNDKKCTIHYTLSAIEKELPSAKFMRVHRSYIVALDKVDTVETGTLFIKKHPIPIGDTQHSALMKRLNLL